MISCRKLVALPILAAFLVAGCSSAAATLTPVTPAPATPVAATPMAATPVAATPVAATPAAATSAPAAGSGATVMTATAGGGTVLVDGSNSMTLYVFSKDTANSGTSACSGACISTWPALTVPAGTTPTAGTGVTGKLGTFKRADDGSLQVTYNGIPLYHYSGDSAPGDTNGNYPGWSPAKP
jgi:predicted lipoprotein with Yx(FWY)xxD motif